MTLKSIATVERPLMVNILFAGTPLEALNWVAAQHVVEARAALAASTWPLASSPPATTASPVAPTRSAS